MTRDRPSLPPGPDSLRRVTERQAATNDALEKTLSDPPLLTDAHRLAVLHEIYAEMRGSGGSTVVAIERYQDRIRARAKA